MTTLRPLVPPADLRAALGPEPTAALEQLRAEVAAEPARLDRLFPAAARRTTRGPLPGGHLAEDAVRVELVAAAAEVLEPDALLTELRALYRHGDADEKRAVVHALNGADDSLDGSDLVLDALRTNDTRLVAAAVGSHAARLSDDDWRQAVLKCLFTGVPVSAVVALDERADDELAAMVGRYAREREAAGREVPDDVRLVLAAAGSPDAAGSPGATDSPHLAADGDL